MKKKLNRPVWKVGNFPVFWINELKTSKWRCRVCEERQEVGSLAFEVWSKTSETILKDNEQEVIQKPIKKYLCLDCAEDMLEEVVEKVRKIK